jgi:hypothetical protein
MKRGASCWTQDTSGRARYCCSTTPSSTSTPGSLRRDHLSAVIEASAPGSRFGDATTVILPLSPTRLAALSSADRFEVVPTSAKFTNSLLVAMAHDCVYL